METLTNIKFSFAYNNLEKLPSKVAHNPLIFSCTAEPLSLPSNHFKGLDLKLNFSKIRQNTKTAGNAMKLHPRSDRTTLFLHISALHIFFA